uniref:Cell death abnormality protein 1-like n=1 Tax=Crassostrea virginica TaxID=6565 RepID=A0A8B8CJ54_CRAVI|nr:cell death abnormality protein 1-like [Crassostrea virginica]
MYIIGYALLFYASFIVLAQGQCYNNSTCECHCDDCSSVCQSCLPGWSGSNSNFCQKENILYHFYGVNSKYSKLLDGDTNTSEENDDPEPSLLVQLKNSTTIKQLYVHLELENGNTYQAYVKSRKTQREDSVRCGTYTHNDMKAKKTITFKCQQPLVGTYLEIVSLLEKPIKVFEIEHYECSNGTYGKQCENICSNACSDQCDKDTGKCVCKTGFWGKLCDKPCPNLCKDSKCNSKSGDCIDCYPGTYGQHCHNNCSQGCIDRCNPSTGVCTCKLGYFLANCSQACPKNCSDSGCIKESGTCLTCITGNYGPLCDLKCLGECGGECNKFTGKCGTCTKTKYGSFCNKTCPVTCEADVCERSTGECEVCKQGFWGDRCSENCSINCENGTCDKSVGECSQCKRGFWGDQCSENCPINCENGTCDKSVGECRQCKRGFWGDRCSENCSINCENGTCDKSVGECRQCKRGFWGDRCSENCSINCENGTCDKSVGECRQCKRGFWGDQCSENCPINCEICADAYKCLNCSDGWYGITCEKPCPNHCGNRRSCHKVTGYCQICFLGYFGNTCTQNCSQDCDPTEICNQEDGKCKNCKAGRRGEYCTETCSVQCKNSTCFRNESCVNGCEDGWFGSKCADKCQLEIKNCAKCKSIDNEVICQSCFDSYYLEGSKCYKCPQNCVSCKSDEKCFQCEDTFFHGVTCNLTCDIACINKTCDIAGHCIHGCEKKKYGSNCNQDCPTECKTCRNSSVCLTCEDGFDVGLCSSSSKGGKHFHFFPCTRRLFDTECCQKKWT